jgi:hypothetical protein
VGLQERLAEIVKSCRSGYVPGPDVIEIPDTQVIGGSKLGDEIRKDTHYFAVRVNEMFLAQGRRWFTEYDPLVFVCTEFNYDGERIRVPFIVGPTMLDYVKESIPAGFVFRNTRVAGLYPYRGERVAITVILYRVQRTNWARHLLGVMESAAGAIDFGSGLPAYLKVADAVLTGVESLLSLGGTVPVTGFRQEFDTHGGDAFKPGYLAMLGPGGPAVPPASIWVKEHRLRRGPTPDATEEFRQSDYVLLSLASTEARSDVDTLPFYSMWQNVLSEAMAPSEDAWELANKSFIGLSREIWFCPDLTEAHADQLVKHYEEQMIAKHDQAVQRAERGPGPDDAKLAQVRAKSMRFLKSK